MSEKYSSQVNGTHELFSHAYKDKFYKPAYQAANASASGAAAAFMQNLGANFAQLLLTGSPDVNLINNTN